MLILGSGRGTRISSQLRQIDRFCPVVKPAIWNTGKFPTSFSSPGFKSGNQATNCWTTLLILA